STSRRVPPGTDLGPRWIVDCRGALPLVGRHLSRRTILVALTLTWPKFHPSHPAELRIHSTICVLVLVQRWQVIRRRLLSGDPDAARQRQMTATPSCEKCVVNRYPVGVPCAVV